MQFGLQASVVGGKTGGLMDWSVNNSYKNLKDMEPKSVMDVALIPIMEPIDGAPGTSDKADHTTKPRKKTMTSIYLKFFETTSDGKNRKCKFCGQSYSISTATGNLGRHLSNRHPGYDKSDDSVSTPVSQPIVVKKPQTQVKASRVDFDHLNWLLTKWLILASLPPSTFEEKWLSNSFKFLNPNVHIWSSEKFQAVLNEVFKSMREDIRCMLANVTSKVSITLEFWTSYQQIFYMSVSCQWIDEQWSFHRLLLDISRVPSPYGSSEIYHTLTKVLKLYTLESRVLSCTHDNSTNAFHAYHTLKEDLASQKPNPFCYVPCAAHALSSVIDDGLRSTKSVIAKIREFALEINSSSEMIEEFNQMTTTYQEGNWKFPLDVSARWSGTYQMLDIVRKASKTMEAIIRKHDETLGRLLLNSTEKNAINLIHTYLEPFYKTTNDMCTNKLPTVGLVLFFMDHISETIAACRESRHSPDWLKNAAIDMGTKVRCYNDQVSNIFTYMTAILDPRIKIELIPESLNLDNYLEEARSHFVRNYSTTHFSSMATSYGSTQELEDGGNNNVSFAEEIARKRRRATMGTATDELTQYLSEPTAPIPTDVLEWWKVNSTRYPRLSVMARDFLAVQATSMAPEDLFCSKGDEVERAKQSIPYSSIQCVLCIRSWIESGLKLKYKSTEIDYERLMELAGVGEDVAGCSEKKHK
ncbi:putative transcription factor/ chromatin remodeling BED-type(Zn) family [Helianthus annuus]|nr:putative transcription factor/ chromatin remodeling BED-type(Zn) family [Helianthus annuus]KAJ0578026.1 putative transcription factor/ chromatin remodeling BED-type(Zn) family [Helianthus annuus]